MEIEFLFPQIIIYSIIASIAFLFSFKKKDKFKKGILVANSKYIKRTKLYKKIMLKYRIYNYLIKAVCIVLIFICALMTSRMYGVADHEEVNEIYDNADVYFYIEEVDDYYYNLGNERVQKDINKIKGLLSKLEKNKVGLVYLETTKSDYYLLVSSPIVLSTLDIYHDNDRYILEKYQETKDYYNKMCNEDKSIKCDGKIYIIDNSMLLASNTLKGRQSVINSFNYLTCYMPTWSSAKNAFYKSHGFSSGYGTYLIRFASDIVATKILSTREIFEFINKRFEEKNSSKKVVVWAKDNYNYEYNNLEDARRYCKENDIELLVLNDYSENEILTKINSYDNKIVEKKTTSKESDYGGVLFSFLLYIFPILFILDWRVRI